MNEKCVYLTYFIMKLQVMIVFDTYVANCKIHSNEKCVPSFVISNFTRFILNRLTKL